MSFWPAVIVGTTLFVAYANGAEGIVMSQSVIGLRLIVDHETACAKLLARTWFRLNGQKGLDIGHFFGIGAANGQARWNVIRTILLAWLLTLPTAALIAALIYSALSRLAI